MSDLATTRIECVVCGEEIEYGQYFENVRGGLTHRSCKELRTTITSRNRLGAKLRLIKKRVTGSNGNLCLTGTDETGRDVRIAGDKTFILSVMS